MAKEAIWHAGLDWAAKHELRGHGSHKLKRSRIAECLVGTDAVDCVPLVIPHSHRASLLRRTLRSDSPPGATRPLPGRARSLALPAMALKGTVGSKQPGTPRLVGGAKFELSYMDPAPSATPFVGARAEPVAVVYPASLRSFD